MMAVVVFVVSGCQQGFRAKRKAALEWPICAPGWSLFYIISVAINYTRISVSAMIHKFYYCP